MGSVDASEQNISMTRRQLRRGGTITSSQQRQWHPHVFSCHNGTRVAPSPVDVRRVHPNLTSAQRHTS
jgi:hypothetical protein